MAVIAITLPYNGTENVNQTGGGSGPITPLASMVDFNNALMFQTGNEGVVKAADGGIATIGTVGDTAWAGGGASGTLVAILKNIAAAIVGTLHVTDSPVATALAGTLQTHAVPSGTVYAGGPTAAPTAGGTLPAQVCSTVTVFNDPASAGTLFVGSPTVWSIPLSPGQWATFPVSNTNLVGIKGATGVTYEYTAVS